MLSFQNKEMEEDLDFSDMGSLISNLLFATRNSELKPTSPNYQLNFAVHCLPGIIFLCLVYRFLYFTPSKAKIHTLSSHRKTQQTNKHTYIVCICNSFLKNRENVVQIWLKARREGKKQRE